MFRFIATRSFLRVVRFISDLRTYSQDLIDMAHDRHKLIYAERAGGAAERPITRVAVVALYPDEDNVLFTANLLRGFAANGFYVLCVSTKRLTPHMAEVLLPHCHHVIERFAIGRDFASYQMGLDWIKRKTNGLEGVKILTLANDSLFYPVTMTDTIKDIVEMPGDWIGLFANYQTRFHVQSFFESFRRPVFSSAAFDAFWHTYRPYTSRTHTIAHGETGLTNAMLNAGFLPHIVYNSEVMKRETATRLMQGSAEMLHRVVCRTVPVKYFAAHQALAAEPHLLAAELASEVSVIAEKLNPTHVTGLLCNALFNAPVKCDISYRGIHTIADVLTLIQGFSHDEMCAMRRFLRRKGVPASTPKWTWRGMQISAGVI
jgi:hypothetical protein